MTEQRPEWYSCLGADPLRRKTFTMKSIQQIEHRVAESDRAHKHRRSVIAAIMVVTALVVVIAVFRLSNSYAPMKSVKATTEPPLTSQTAVQTPADILDDHLYKLKGEVEAIEQPSYIYGVMPPKFVANSDQDYKIIATDGEFVQIVPADSPDEQHTGWIPKWYLNTAENTAKIQILIPHVRIVSTPVAYSLYPDQPEHSGFELETGKVVQVTGRFGSWLRVNIITYDSPNNGDKWVPESALIDWDPSKALEGFLKPGAKVYDEQGNPIDADVPGNDPIKISPNPSGKYFHITSTGGYSGYINRKDFIPNPFRTLFPVNENGQTYGSSGDATSPDTEPDLIRASGVDGTVGYVMKKDLDGPQPKTPEEALEMQKNRPPGGRDIPLYDRDGKTVIGVFHVGP